jgi:hypothetical protein
LFILAKKVNRQWFLAVVHIFDSIVDRLDAHNRQDGTEDLGKHTRARTRTAMHLIDHNRVGTISANKCGRDVQVSNVVLAAVQHRPIGGDQWLQASAHIILTNRSDPTYLKCRSLMIRE